MAPLIAALLGKGLDLVANAALKEGTEFIKEKTGIAVDLQTTPEGTQLAGLKTYQDEAKDELERMRLEKDALALYLADVQNARAMQIAALAQEDPLPKRFVYTFATGWSCFAAFYICAITFSDIPPDNVRFADTILGFLLGTIIAALFQFFYGSSQGSVKGSQALRDIARKVTGA